MDTSFTTPVVWRRRPSQVAEVIEASGTDIGAGGSVLPRRWIVGRLTSGRPGTSDRSVQPATSMRSPGA